MNKTTFLLLALSISVSYVLTSPHLDFFEKLGVDLDDAAESLVDGFKNVTAAGVGAAEGFVNSVQNVSSVVGKQAQKLAIQISQALHEAAVKAVKDFVTNLKSVIERLEDNISNVTSSIKKEVLSGVLENLKIINAAALELQDDWDSAVARFDSGKARLLAEINEKIRIWAANELERVNSTTNGRGNDEAQKIIDELLSRYENKINDCVENFVTRQGQYEDKIQNTVTSLNSATTELAGDIEICLYGKSGSEQCRISIKSALKKLEEAPQQLLALKEEGLQILALGIEAGSCVSATIAAFELEKSEIIEQLDEIIALYSEDTTEG